MDEVSLGALLLRLVVSMGVVVSLMLLAARLLRRTAGRTGGRTRGGKVRRTPITIAASQPITKAAHVAVVRAGGRELVVGVTDHQVTLLHSAIEPRDDLEDLDVATTSDELRTPLAVGSATTAAQPLTDIAGARIAPATTTPAQGIPQATQGSQSAWTDALEMLREKTVRR